MLDRINLRRLAWVNRIHHGTDVMDALANLAPEGRIKRVLSACAPMARGLDSLADLAVVEGSESWYTHDNFDTVKQGVVRYGERLVKLSQGHHCEAEVWIVGEHVVMWRKNIMREGSICSPSTAAEIAATVLDAALADIGTNARARISMAGLVADDEVAPEFVAAKIADTRDKLRVELAHAPRSLLLHGPPGGGKTGASRQLVEELADNAIVVDSAMVSAHRSTDVFELLTLWKPSAVVFDDLDHTLCGMESEGRVLAGLDRVRRVVPLVIATVNDSRQLSGALARRFSRIVHIDSLDVEIATRMLGDTPDAIREAAIAGGLLASYVAELNLRCRLGTDVPADALAEQLERQAQAGDGLWAMNSVATCQTKASR